MSFRIATGATATDPSLPLCSDCKRVWKMKDSRGNVTFRFQIMGQTLRAKVVECSQFHPANEPDIHEYESLAWLLSPNDKGEPAFVRLRDLESTGKLVPIGGF